MSDPVSHPQGAQPDPQGSRQSFGSTSPQKSKPHQAPVRPEATRMMTPAPNQGGSLAPVEAEPEKFPTFNRYVGAGSEPFSETIQTELQKEPPDNIVEITPDGRIYIPASHFRDALNRSFSRGGWSMLPWSDRIMKEKHMYREYALYVNGRFVAEAIGEQEYIEKNSRFTYGDAAEGCKSNALTRCCKELGIYSQAWDPSWRDGWKKRMAVRVECAKNGERETKKLWRRKDRGRLYSSGWYELNGQGGGAQQSAPRGGGRGTQASQSSGQRPQGGGSPGAKQQQRPSQGTSQAAPQGTQQKPQQPNQQGAQQRNPHAALHQQIMIGLKKCAGGKEDEARALLGNLTGKQRLRDCDPKLLQSLVPILQKLGRGEARTETSGEGIVVVDQTSGAYLWPPNYQPPGGSDAPPDVPNDPTDFPDEAPPQGPEGDVPPGDGPPSGGDSEFGF